MTLMHLMNKVLEIGRHYNTTILIINHLPCDGRLTRRVLNEASVVVYFPHSANNKIRYSLTEYVGVNVKMTKY